MRKILAALWSGSLLFGEVLVYVDPQQYFNNTDNYANRIVYFFIEKRADGSVSLQIQPPPFYASDYSFLSKGIAYIDSKKVLQNYTADQVASLKEVDITFTVEAIPNTKSPNGYVLFGQMFQWIINLDPTTTSYYSLQSTNLSMGNSLEVLKIAQYNPSDKLLMMYSKIQDLYFWSSGAEGIFLSNSLTENTLVQERRGKTPTNTDITISVDLSKIPAIATGVYSMYFQFQMVAIEPTTTFLQVLNDLSNVQVIQINYLTNSILSINAYLDSKNELYVPSPVEQDILRHNKEFLFDQYNVILAAMKEQWDEFAQQPRLSTQTLSLIRQMQAFIFAAQNSTAKFQLYL